MKISNPARKTAISVPFERADTLFTRARGLMFRSRPLAILFTFDYTGHHSIHSFFVPFEFDAVFLDENWKVVDSYERVRPFTHLITPVRPASYLLEMPAGHASKLKIRNGDVLKLNE